MSGISVPDYLKRLDQLASMSLTAPEIMASASKRQPLGALSSNKRTSERTSAKDLGMVKPSLPQQVFAAFKSSQTLAADRDAKAEDRSEDDSARHAAASEDDDDQVPAFRQRTVWSDPNPELGDMWTLKRATPIFDENDEEDLGAIYQSPTKKTRVQTLTWTDSVDTQGSHCLEELCRGL